MCSKRPSLVYNYNAHGSMASMPHLQCYPYEDTSYRAGRNVAEVSQKRYRYTGKEKDEESGLYYHGARYYACWLGRWTAADPAGLADGVNLYMYCRGNPVRFIDDDGSASNDMLLLEPQIAKQDILKTPDSRFGDNKFVKYADQMHIEVNVSDDMLLLEPQIAKQDILKTPDFRFGDNKSMKHSGQMSIGVINGKTVTLPTEKFELEKKKSSLNAQADALNSLTGSLSYSIASIFNNDPNFLLKVSQTGMTLGNIVSLRTSLSIISSGQLQNNPVSRTSEIVIENSGVLIPKGTSEQVNAILDKNVKPERLK